MPTAKTRVQVTVDDDLRQVMDRARQLWPDLPESRLIARLARRGGDSLGAELTDRAAARAATLAKVAGEFNDCFPADYLTALRDEWPA